MALVTMKQLVDEAWEKGTCIPAFNVGSLEMVRGALRAAEELETPVIIQIAERLLKYSPLELIGPGMVQAAKESRLPVAVSLDHSSTYDVIKKALDLGFTSVMYDGSTLPFEENIAISKKVADMAAAVGIPTEAELGKVGGKEDDTVSSGDDIYTDPQEAKEFAERTGISSLAVGIGTAHGFYKGTPVLDVNRLAEIREVVDIPLVLHGASGLTDEQVRSCVERGICKVNFATELRKAYTDAVKKYISEDPDVFDPKKYQAAGRAAVVEQVKYRMKVCGCDGKAKI